jgi:hypothetical protein
MTKRISIVVTYDTESEKFVVDGDTTEVHFPEGLCWDDETEHWADEPLLVEDVVQRLAVQLSSPAPPAAPSAKEPVAISTKFIELALNILDPDFTWDAEETLAAGDAAGRFLREYPITDWEIEGAFGLVVQFVHDWATGDSRDPVATTDSVVELFITSALTMVDPDCQWDAEDVLDFSDSARQYLDEHPIVGIEHDRQLVNTVESFVGEWQDVNPLPMEFGYQPNTDAELEVLDDGIASGLVIE